MKSQTKKKESGRSPALMDKVSIKILDNNVDTPQKDLRMKSKINE